MWIEWKNGLSCNCYIIIQLKRVHTYKNTYIYIYKDKLKFVHNSHYYKLAIFLSVSLAFKILIFAFFLLSNNYNFFVFFSSLSFLHAAFLDNCSNCCCCCFKSASSIEILSCCWLFKSCMLAKFWLMLLSSVAFELLFCCLAGLIWLLFVMSVLVFACGEFMLSLLAFVMSACWLSKSLSANIDDCWSNNVRWGLIGAWRAVRPPPIRFKPVLPFIAGKRAPRLLLAFACCTPLVVCCCCCCGVVDVETVEKGDELLNDDDDELPPVVVVVVAGNIELQ